MNEILKEILAELQGIKEKVGEQGETLRGQGETLREQGETLREHSQLLRALEEHALVTRAMVTRLGEDMDHIRGEQTALRQEAEDMREKVDYTLFKIAEHDAKFMAIRKSAEAG